MKILDHAAEERFWAKVNKTDTCWLWTASKMKWGGYGQFGALLQTTGKRGVWAAHRISYELAKGPIPEGMFIDHMCHVRHCVNPAHLRPVTAKQNIENHTGLQRTNKSGVRGAWWSPERERWRTQVTHNRKRYSAGYHRTLEQAEAAVVALRNQLHTHNDIDRKSA